LFIDSIAEEYVKALSFGAVFLALACRELLIFCLANNPRLIQIRSPESIYVTWPPKQNK